jgi:hypothetical protein
MMFLELVGQSINCYNIALIMLIHLSFVYTCGGVHAFLPSKILYVILH